MRKAVFCIIGKSGAGKSTILDLIAKDDEFLTKTNLKKMIYYTTRKPRDNEVNGVDYYFARGMGEYMSHAYLDDIVESRTYNTYTGKVVYYTTTGIFTQDDKNLICTASVNQAISYIKNRDSLNIDVYIIHIDTPSIKDRMIKVLGRCDNDTQAMEAIRRVSDENKEFSKCTILAEDTDKYICLMNEYTQQSLIDLKANLMSFIESKLK